MRLSLCCWLDTDGLIFSAGLAAAGGGEAGFHSCHCEAGGGGAAGWAREADSLFSARSTGEDDEIFKALGTNTDGLALSAGFNDAGGEAGFHSCHCEAGGGGAAGSGSV